MTEQGGGDVTIQPQAAMLVVTGGVPAVRIRDYLASQHLWTARRESELCRLREDRIGVSTELDRCRLSHATNTVLAAVAFLDAFIGSVWQDAADGERNHLTANIPDSALAEMRRLWKGDKNAERRYGIVKKFQTALTLSGRDRIPEHADLLESVKVLVEFRNALVHFKPRWREHGKDIDLDKILKSKITSDLAYPAHMQPWFPHKPLSAKSARWACDTVIAFTRDWHSRMGMSGDFDSYYVASDPFEIE
ncbi:hypothetical protein [[Mycobacterium] holstebronense]|uniref:Uncharacterized protein n=1 Tax=[Mycobacterium] holstebronense TaxID=3064288 RepID=A0ABN9NCL5_9MYCO|nr:hypothetical protein [Mycolicibacter sp. MU0102]CAJ1504174.1 hypothetical protein MU0102_002178 [Mycolicibacter sp. MU0102]